MEKHTWAERIQWCEQAKLSRREIADHCGMAYSTLSDVFNGRTVEPRGYAAVRLHALSEKHRPTTKTA